jgi:SAM-dependent methyltransferase
MRVTEHRLSSGQKPATVKAHYADHLGPIYSWMVGDFNAACQSSSKFFHQLSSLPSTTGIAVDLGCGHGVQSVPLAQMGFTVISIDNCQELINQLKANAADLPITPVNDDLLNLTAHVPQAADVIVCMGDTLTHLQSFEEVNRLLVSCANLLIGGGSLILAFRDYVSNVLHGDDRLFKVRTDQNRTHLCRLSYLDEIVIVEDLVHTLHADGLWRWSVSSYPKLRLNPQFIMTSAASQDLILSHLSIQNGMLRLAFHKS